MTRTRTYLQLPVSDMARAARFYKQAFNLTAAMESPYWSEFSLATNVILALHGGMQGGIEMGLGFEVEDVSSAVAEVEAAGGRVFAPVEDKPNEGIRIATVTDPDGNHIRIAQPLAR
ncbi:MAG: VOC family protein [Chloroflexota bacterium]